ncbi:hypothetical protein [Anaerotruncus massiliensis (ex Togo et al. 2019)]|uniref:hypothetical protein n=1 Tax=Anaerotruncus TaxID=244127 RepID=UPI000C790348|nr:hypothetical protein [Anaerotruncus massiliensis (ex Togo et al. 2019)]
MISSPELRGEIRKQMDIRRWDSEDLGRATGYAGSTVRKYMCDTTKAASDAFERAVCRALQIDPLMYILSHKEAV